MTNYNPHNNFMEQSLEPSSFDTNTTRKSVRAAISFSNTELAYFEDLFKTITHDGLTATGAKVVPLFRTSGVKNEFLKEIWLKSATQSNALSKSEFFCALLL